MAQLINIPGGTASFPDEMSKDQIEGVLQQHFKESQSQPNQPQVNKLQEVANSPVVSNINALGGGIQQGISDVINTATGTNIAPNAPPIAQQAMQENPTTGIIGKGIGIVAPAVGLTAASGGLTAPVLGNGLLNLAAANTIASSILAGPENRTLGAGIGLATSAVAPIVTSTAKYLGSAFSIGTKVKNFVSEIGQKISGPPDVVAATSQANMFTASEATENQLFNSFRNVTGEVQVDPITHKASTFLNSNLDELTPVQQKSIENLINNVNRSKTLSQLHDARKSFAYDFAKFTEGKPLTGEAHTEFRGLTDTINSTIRNNAEQLGVGKEFKVANDYYQNHHLPLINTGAKDTAEALANAQKDPLTAARITDTLINKYVKDQRPETAKAFLNTLDDTGRQAVEVQMINNSVKSATQASGDIDYLTLKQSLAQTQKSYAPIFSDNTKKLIKGLDLSIDEATQIAGMTLDLARIGPTSKLYAAGGTLGAIAYSAGGATAVGAGAIAVGLSKILQSKIGQSLLIKAGSPGGKEVGKNLVNGLMVQGILSQVNNPPEVK